MCLLVDWSAYGVRIPATAKHAAAIGCLQVVRIEQLPMISLAVATATQLKCCIFDRVDIVISGMLTHPTTFSGHSWQSRTCRHSCAAAS